MTIQPNVGPHLRYPFDLLPGGWLLVEGPDELRHGLVDALREAAYGGAKPLWRDPPVITGRPATDDADAEVIHHQQVVRRARKEGRFVIQDGSWLGRLATNVQRDAKHLSQALAVGHEEVWGADQQSLVVFLLDGDAARSRVWVAAGTHLPHQVLMPSAWDLNERLMALFSELRHRRLHGRLV